MTNIIMMHKDVWISDAMMNLRKYQMKHHAVFQMKSVANLDIRFGGWFKQKDISVAQLLLIGYYTIDTRNPKWPFIVVAKSDIIFNSECPAVFVGQNGGTCRDLGY